MPIARIRYIGGDGVSVLRPEHAENVTFKGALFTWSLHHDFVSSDK